MDRPDGRGDKSEPEHAEVGVGVEVAREEKKEEHHHVYIFKRLRRTLPAPSKRRLTAIYVGLCISMVLCGWTDGSMGPLIPSLQHHFGINYLVMSLIYTTGFVGSMVAGLSNVWITDRIGFALATCLGALAQAVAYLLMGSGAHYAVFLIAFAINLFGLGLQDAQVNNITTRLPGAATKMMVVQACFGLGGTLAPLAATAFAEHVADKAYYYFFVAFGVALIALGVMFVAFDMRTEEQIESWRLEGEGGSGREGSSEVRDGDDPARPQRATEQPESPARSMEHHTIIERDGTVPPLPPDTAPPQTSGAKLMRILRTPSVYALLAFSFLYIGVEVAISSWSVTFLRRERGGTAAAGYVSTGFWGGMTVSRIVLIPVTKRLGYQLSIYLYSGLALALELVIWFTHSLIGNGVCYAFVGFALGPVYPVALMVVSSVYDDDLRGGVMGLMGSMGGAGAAAVPFIAGAIADKYGIWTIQPVSVGMIAAYVVLWALVPRHRPSAAGKGKANVDGEEKRGGEGEDVRGV